MQVTLKVAFNILDGRLSTNIGDVYMLLNYIFSANLFTHQLPDAMNQLLNANPDWFKEGKKKISQIKYMEQTNDFDKLMKIIDKYYSDTMVEIGKLKEVKP